MRKNIKPNIIKALLANSGNRCAFPGCNQPIVNEEHKIIAQLCHIEAASQNGPRYNKEQNDEERNGYDNLMFMCYKHHHETHDIDIYPVSKLKQTLPSSILKEFIKMSINMNLSFYDLMKEIKEAIEYIEDDSNIIIGQVDTLNDRIIKHLETLGYNTSNWKKQHYYDNPFENPDWEMLHLGMPNLINIIKYRLIQIEILYYSEYLKLHNNDNLMRQQLEKSKTELMSVAGELMYYD